MVNLLNKFLINTLKTGPFTKKEKNKVKKSWRCFLPNFKSTTRLWKKRAQQKK